MGRFWQSSAPSRGQGSSDSATPSPSAALPPTPASSAEPQPEPAAADREMAMFMHMLLKDTQPSSDPSPSQPAPQEQPVSHPDSKSKPSSWFSWASTRSRGGSDELSSSPSDQQQQQQQQRPQTKASRTRNPQSLAMSEHLLPTTMSCRDAFDYAWHCHTPGSQWNAVYRYGSVRSCSELWDDFWFCMRTKSYTPEMRAEAIKAHYRAKEEAKYGGGMPSSEDVWESRREKVPPGTAFRAKFDPPIADDAEFQRADAERRRRIREMIGVEEKDGNRE